MKRVGVLVLLTFVFICCFCGRNSTTPYKFPVLKHFPMMPVELDNAVTVEGAKLGRYLFYDMSLSGDKKLSCGGCHKQANAFSDSPNQYSKSKKKVFTKRNSMALFNLAWYPSWYWDGEAACIEDLVASHVRASDVMSINWHETIDLLNKNNEYPPLFNAAFGDKKIDSTRIVKALAQFLRTLISYQSRYDRAISGKRSFTGDEYEGFQLMRDVNKGGCISCHISETDALGTSLEFSNNGLDTATTPQSYKDKGLGAVTLNPRDNGKFVVPSLRNVEVTAPYMHDGRFKTLEEVMNFYSEGVKQSVNIDSKMTFAHQGGAKLTATEKQQIIAFMKTMTDSVFITNKEFSNPFIKTK